MKEKTKIDELDRGIMEALHSDPEITNTEIAERVGVSQPTVGVRLKALKESGALGHAFGVSPDEWGCLLLAKARGSGLQRAAEEISRGPGVVLCLLTGGEWGLLALISAPDYGVGLERAERLLGSRRGIDRVATELVFGLESDCKIFLRPGDDLLGD
jgi:DNA-binding Lrp family transcriptional regulator